MSKNFTDIEVEQMPEGQMLPEIVLSGEMPFVLECQIWMVFNRDFTIIFLKVADSEKIYYSNLPTQTQIQ